MRKLLLLLPFMCLFMSCTKETSYETPIATGTTLSGTSTGTATYTLGGSGSTCTGAVVNGIYQAGTALVVSDTVQLQITVDSIGTYAVSTNTTNGIVFSASGTFTKTGPQTITLIGKGTPVGAGNITFTPPVGKGCSFIVPILSATTTTTRAVYTLAGDSLNSCSGAILKGIYTVGTVLNTSNSVSITVNVTTAGSYTISTPTINGIIFKATGIFSATGIQTISLAGSGTPTSAAISTFTPIIGNSTCSFSVPVVAPVPAAFTLAGAPNACTVATIKGTYTATIALTTANTVTVSVNVTAIGNYTLTTNAVNGISFSTKGTFTATGVQNVTLTGTGNPIAAGNSTFTPLVDSSKCTFIVPVAAAPVPAVYTMAGAPNACTGAIVNGTYTASIALTSANTAIVSVNVTTIGTYTLATNTVNGIKFTGTGTFTAMGTQNMTLIGSGTPTAAATSTLTPQIGTSGCTFDVIVAAAPAVAPGIYNCKIDGVYNSFFDRASAQLKDFTGAAELAIDGYVAVSSAIYTPHFQIFINHINNSPVAAGSYNVDGYLVTNGYRLEIDYFATNPDSTVTIWNTSSTLFTPNPPFTVVVTSATATRIKGTFSGKITNLLQGSTIQKTITEGVFDVPVQ